MDLSLSKIEISTLIRISTFIPNPCLAMPGGACKFKSVQLEFAKWTAPFFQFDYFGLDFLLLLESATSKTNVYLLLAFAAFLLCRKSSTPQNSGKLAGKLNSEWDCFLTTTFAAVAWKGNHNFIFLNQSQLALLKKRERIRIRVMICLMTFAVTLALYKAPRRRLAYEKECLKTATLLSHVPFKRFRALLGFAQMFIARKKTNERRQRSRNFA